MSTRILFLDIDGVVNSVVSRKLYRKDEPVPVPEKDHYRIQKPGPVFPQSLFDPDAVVQVNRIWKETGCQVVLSSMWRLMFGSIFSVELALKHRGFEGSLSSRTPESKTRSHEILAWLQEHDPRGEASVAILDDEELGDEDMASYLVKTDFETGLTVPLADETIRRLLLPAVEGQAPWISGHRPPVKAGWSMSGSGLFIPSRSSEEPP